MRRETRMSKWGEETRKRKIIQKERIKRIQETNKVVEGKEEEEKNKKRDINCLKDEKGKERKKKNIQRKKRNKVKERKR